MSTLTHCGNQIYRINHPATNAALTRMGGVPSPKLHGRLIKALGITNISEQVGIAFEFRRGNNSRKWYFRTYPV